ncbi:MAG TPA: hypothetical protein VLA72_15460 [Anaerolineales bacterium]|nr:hypothetical protein [Anaerolineales bacterium]
MFIRDFPYIVLFLGAGKLYPQPSGKCPASPTKCPIPIIQFPMKRTGLFYIRPPSSGQEAPALTSTTRMIHPWIYHILVEETFSGSNREQRNPLLLFVFVGLFLLRLAERTLLLLLFHVPPRSTPPVSLHNRPRA